MFGTLQSAKRKVIITFDDDGKPVPRQEVSRNLEKERPKEFEAGSTEASTPSIDTKQVTISLESPPSPRPSLHTAVKPPDAASSLGEAKQPQHRQKRKQQFQGNDAQAKKFTTQEATTDRVLQRAKELRKHRRALPIFTGMSTRKVCHHA